MIVDMDEAAVYACPTYRMLATAFDGVGNAQDVSSSGGDGDSDDGGGDEGVLQ